jgi:tRNA modification GTPase
MQQETVAAIVTPPGRGGIAVIRLSGRQSYQVAAKVFAPQNTNKKIEVTEGYTALFGRFLSGQRMIDEGIALCFRAPHSYTGEDVIELSCHGGEEVSMELLTACLQAGAFPAGPGEFTKRAVLNGRLSLTQAEAVMDLISATSRQGVAAAEAALGGALYRAIDEQRKNLTNLAGHLAAWVDYPEEDVSALTEEEFLGGVQMTQAVLQKLINGYDAGSILLRGVHKYTS